MERPKCPTCSAPVTGRSEGNQSFPFCSPRCRALDLGNWIDERYRIGDESVTDVRWPDDD